MTYDPNTDPAMAAFASIGTPVPASEVPALVRAGVTVYAFGYGDGTEAGFDALDEGDLWAWSDPEIGADVVASWAPFVTERNPE